MSEKHYFADTSFLIDLYNADEKAVAIHDEATSVVTSVICLYELSKLTEFDPERLTTNTVKELDSDDVKQAPRFYRELTEEGEKINETNYLIAGQAANTDRTLVTRDKDFTKLEPLHVKTY